MKHDLAILNELKPDGTLKLTTDKARKRNIFDVMKEQQTGLRRSPCERVQRGKN